ncbi:uncharacterized protein PHACADRAFT_204957 [Phanerochaete carnosa HHB-10118-sp]|uniref:Uncharacterized protein n=1 Tax=Phanerochaete carnosa (strain HHB-10118-sp) TaxID=650164 RepID=K5WCZ8_PHACS|nr:uncharacterized protein PHACADRAFT_204957 [Phanerochaete carnosa HHB-10118-sp]EKM61803.1 hypothetical protein PHACADRAFT_204957 [Phanerochaete carnosa HHB-10118-sp]
MASESAFSEWKLSGLNPRPSGLNGLATHQAGSDSIRIESESAATLVSPELTFEQFVAAYRASGYLSMSTTLRDRDLAVYRWGQSLRLMWAWEGEIVGRNRWQELQDRGGDVHRDWLVIPPNSTTMTRSLYDEDEDFDPPDLEDEDVEEATNG